MAWLDAGCDAMRRLRDGEWKEHRYIGFCVLEDGEAVLVSDKHVCVHAFTNHEEKWAAAVSTVKDISVEGRVVSLSVEVDVVGAAGAKEVVSEAVAKQLTCTDNRCSPPPVSKVSVGSAGSSPSCRFLVSEFIHSFVKSLSW